jgi:hypothetical protein
MAERADLIDLGQDPIGERTVPLEEKYREQMRQIVSQKIELPVSTLEDMIDEQINLNPEFQRRDRWDRNKQSRFIESIVMNVPIPPVFLGEDQYGKYVVLDGRQRLTAIYTYLKNEFELKGLEVWDELNGLKYRELQKKKLEAILTRRFLPAVVILKESTPTVKYDVFDRLNTGGIIAEEMEIRNAVFPGKFNRLLHTLSDQAMFRRLWNIPLDDDQREANPLYQKMTDLELVLRFFALREYKSMDMKFKDYLGDFMERRNAEYLKRPELEDQDAQDFARAIENSWRIFNEQAFTKPGGDGRKSAPLGDAVMVALSEVAPDSITDIVADRIKTGFANLLQNSEDYKKAIGTGTNGKGAIRSRIEATQGLVRDAIGH